MHEGPTKKKAPQEQAAVPLTTAILDANVKSGIDVPPGEDMGKETSESPLLDKPASDFFTRERAEAAGATGVQAARLETILKREVGRFQQYDWSTMALRDCLYVMDNMKTFLNAPGMGPIVGNVFRKMLADAAIPFKESYRD